MGESDGDCKSPSSEVETGELVKLEALPLAGLASVDGGRRYACTFVAAGRVRRRDGKPSTWVISPEALQAAVDKFAGVAVFVDHPGWLDDGRSVRDLAGVTERDARFVQDHIEGTIRLYTEGAGAWLSVLLDQVLEDRQLGKEAPDVGLSPVFYHRTEVVDEDRITIEFTHVESVDVVFGPGTRTAVKAALQAVGMEGQEGQVQDLSGGGQVPAGRGQVPAGRGQVQDLPLQQGMGAKPRGGSEMSEENVAQQPVGGGDGAPPAAPAPAPAAVQPVDVSAGFGGLTPQQVASLQKSYEASQQLLVGQCQAYLDAQITMLTGQLPQASLDHLRKQFGGRVFATSELEAAVDGQKSLMAELHQAGVIRGMGVTEGQMLNDLDQITLAYEKLMGLEVEGPVQRLTGIKELYLMLTGDRAMRGVFNAELAMLQNTTSAAMAEVTRNVMNKVLMDQWIRIAEAGYGWYKKVCHEEDFTNTQQISWVCPDGFANLNVVLEGGAYQEIVWDDARETSDWEKYGGYVGLTLEMIDRDDIGAWKAVPRGLATAGIRTLSGLVAALFTANGGTGPTLNDTFNFFDAANHANLITQFLDPDTWDTAVQTMYAQTEQGSGLRLGIRPKYLLVPVELEKKGRQVLGSGVEPVSGVFYENVRKQAVENCITVPEWTDDDSWAAVADPVLCPCLGVGYRWGRVPELFTVTDPRMGLMFTNDTLPIKVRFMIAVGVINYRGAVKSNM